MNARRFSSRDIESINKWLRRHGHATASVSDVPAIGFIVPGVAAGFVRDCENGVGMIDSYVTNPLCKNLTRNQALNSITRAILKTNFRQFITMTENQGLRNRFLAHGMTPMPSYTWFVKGAD